MGIPSFDNKTSGGRYKYIKTLVIWRGFTILVELSGIEPLTSCMPCKRSPS